MYKLSKNDFNILDSLSNKKLAILYFKLNDWQTPKEFPELKDFKEYPKRNDSKFWAIMEYIKFTVGNKALYKYHNKQMGDEEFNKWVRKNWDSLV